MKQEKVFYKEAGMRIKELRESRRLTREKLSLKIGISPQYLYKIERGDACFSSEILYRISRIFGVGCDYILSGEQPQVGMSFLLRLFGEFTEDEKKMIRESLIQEAMESSAQQGKKAAEAKKPKPAGGKKSAGRTRAAKRKKAAQGKKEAMEDVAATKES